ncbi:MAG: hypothetical protein K9G65_02030, partial [Rickettsiaceae bacterium]|nr:hypothetical protein [Rickettsiaceae bacterium]
MKKIFPEFSLKTRHIRKRLVNQLYYYNTGYLSKTNILDQEVINKIKHLPLLLKTCIVGVFRT